MKEDADEGRETMRNAMNAEIKRQERLRIGCEDVLVGHIVCATLCSALIPICKT